MLLDNHANDYEQASLVNLLLFHSYHNYHHIPSHLNRLTCTNNYYFRNNLILYKLETTNIINIAQIIIETTNIITID